MAVKVRRERPDQRRHHRVTAPFFIEFGGHRLRAADWSLGGFRLKDFPGQLPAVGDELALHLTLPFQGFDVSFDAQAKIVRTDPSGGVIAGRFTELGERERELMSHFIEELVRGSMMDVDETIQRIDVPVTPASLKPDVNPLANIPVRRWPAKAIAMTTAYALIGLFVFGYVGLLTYSNFVQMEVQTAVISAPVEAVAAQAEGRVAWTSLRPGDRVGRGEVVLKLLDNQLEREIDMADIAIAEQKAQLGYLKQRQVDELQRMRGFADIDIKNVRQSKLEVEALMAQLEAAQNHFERMKHLIARGFTTRTKYDDAYQRVITLQKRLESRRLELRSRIDLLERNFGRRHYTGENFVGDIARLEAQESLGRNKLRAARQKHRALLNARIRLSVVAPYDGTILELPRVDHGHVKRGDIVAIIEQRRTRQVTAYLTQDEVQKVGLGDSALVYIPAIGKTLKCRVTLIDRTSGFINEQEQRRRPGYNWRGPMDRSAKVILAFEEPRKVEDFETYRSGLPVVVVFARRSSNPLIGSIKQHLASLL